MTLGNPVIASPGMQARAAAQRHLDALAKPLGALGQLEDLAIWLAGVQGTAAPTPPTSVAVTLFAGDHGVTTGARAVSAYPREVTAAMVREFLRGGAAVNVLARLHNAHVQVFDLGVDDDMDGIPDHVLKHKVRRGSGAIDHEDALTADETETALSAGAVIADERIQGGPDLLIVGDMGIGNTTVTAALTGATLGLGAEQVTGTGTGIDEDTLARKRAVVTAAISRARPHSDDPVALLQMAGSADIAAMTGFLVRSAERGVPTLLDGVVSGACGLLAERIAPGAALWWYAGHRSTEPAHRLALAALRMEPVLDLGMRLGEGTGALMALPLVRAAPVLLAEMSTLADITGTTPDAPA